MNTNSTARNPQASDTAAKRQDGTLTDPLIDPGAARGSRNAAIEYRTPEQCAVYLRVFGRVPQTFGEQYAADEALSGGQQ